MCAQADKLQERLRTLQTERQQPEQQGVGTPAEGLPNIGEGDDTATSTPVLPATNEVDAWKQINRAQMIQLNPRVSWQQENPKKNKSHAAYERYKKATNLKEFFDLGGNKGIFIWDLERGFVIVHGSDS